MASGCGNVVFRSVSVVSGVHTAAYVCHADAPPLKGSGNPVSRPLDDVLEVGRRLDMSSIVEDQLPRWREDLWRVKLRIMKTLVNWASCDFYVRSLVLPGPAEQRVIVLSSRHLCLASGTMIENLQLGDNCEYGDGGRSRIMRLEESRVPLDK